jgi:hypothetical protein
MASSKPRSQLGQVLIDFSTNGAFPEEEAVSAAYAEPSALPSALVAVRDAKAALEVGSTASFILERLPAELPLIIFYSFSKIELSALQEPSNILLAISQNILPCPAHLNIDLYCAPC